MEAKKPEKPLSVMMLGSKEYPFGSSQAYDRRAGGGIEIHTEKLAKFLAIEGHNVHVVTRQFPGQQMDEVTGENNRIHVHRTRFLYNKILRAMSYNFFASIRALKIIRKERVDVIHCHGPVAGFFGVLLSKLTGKPMVFTPHGTVSTWSSPIREILRLFEGLSVLSAKKTIFISKQAQKEMTAVMKFSNTLLTNAIDMDDYAGETTRSGKPTKFLFIGRLEKVKGIMSILEAFDRFTKERPEAGASLTIAGDGAMRNEVESFIERKHAKNINFLGWVDIVDVPGLLSEHDVFLLPSWEKGQPVALLEAMASGAVIITSLNYIKDMDTGISVRPGDPEDLYRKMLYVYESVGCREIGERARTEVRKIGWGIVIKSFLKEYKTVKGDD
jgi:glycosyltransferase involved in cell wall biosynthesis